MQHVMGKSISALPDAAQIQGAQHLKGCKMLLATYIPLMLSH